MIPSDPKLLARVARYEFGAAPSPVHAMLVAAPPAPVTTYTTDGTALPVLDRSSIVFTPQAYDSTIVPNCVCAALGNAMNAVAKLSGRVLPFNSGKPVDWFAYLLGIIKNEAPATDPALNPAYAAAMNKAGGISPLTVLFSMQYAGLNIGQQIVTGTFGLIFSPSVPVLAAALCSPLGPCLWAVNLNANDLATKPSGLLWDTSPTDGPGTTGHMIMAWDYTGLGPTDIVRFATWGGWKRATWRWVMSRMYAQEAYGVIIPSIVSAGWYASLNPSLYIAL
jgi:hypothetical protein